MPGLYMYSWLHEASCPPKTTGLHRGAVLVLLVGLIAMQNILLSTRQHNNQEPSRAISIIKSSDEFSGTPLPCVDELLNLTRQNELMPVEWKQYLEYAIASLTFEGREKWATTLSPTILDDTKTLMHRLRPRRCPTRTDSPDKSNVAFASISNGVVANMQEWLFYHLLLGVEKFFLCDDSMPETVERERFYSAIKPFVEVGFLELIDAHMFDGQGWGPKQVGCYNHILNRYGKGYRWMGFFDTDEFVIPRAKECLPDFLADYTDYGGLAVQWKLFSMIGVFHHDPTRSYFEQYRYPMTDGKYHVKSFVQPTRTSSYHIHNGEHVSGYYSVNTLYQRLDGPKNIRNLTDDEAYGKAEVRHILFGDLYASLYEKMCGLTGARRAKAGTRIRLLRKCFAQSPIVPEEPLRLPPLHDRLVSGMYDRNVN